MVIAHPVPQISISLAPPQDPLIEPVSPFAWASATLEDDDSPRPKLLTPPPSNVRFPRQMSPLSPLAAAGKGLERDRFEALLKASRERNAVTGSRKTNDLRKEIALKAHKNKQVERRALFLSKVLAPPSPTATSLPKTPPDSPAIFHYTLPSPGLVSPLALFESLNEKSISGPLTDTREPWVEQVDFRLPSSGLSKSRTSGESRAVKPLPSLAQISARLSSQAHIRTSPTENTGRVPRLPAFLAQARQPAPVERVRPAGARDRLQLPLRAPKPSKAEHLSILPPKSPCSPLSPQLQVTTILVPRSSTLSPTELSESNLQALDSRERRSLDMLSTLRRRVSPESDNGVYGDGESETDDRRIRRHSAPADLSPHKPRIGFEHPILSVPGAF